MKHAKSKQNKIIYSHPKSLHPAFVDWLNKTQRGEKLPRGKFFKHFANKKGFKVKDLFRDEFWQLMQSKDFQQVARNTVTANRQWSEFWSACNFVRYPKNKY